MATYQGESWVDVQIATIVAQDSEDWRLLIRDDGSTDRTREIIRWWRDRFPHKIVILDEDTPQNLGLCGNFSALMRASSAPFAMFASWDDVWYRDKVSRGVRAIRALESKHGAKCPLLSYTDVRTVDSNLHEIHPSGLRHLGRGSARKRTLGGFCLENTAWGCALIVNRALLELGSPIPSAARCEDFWLALIASAFGVIEARPEISLDWRRHRVNDSAVSFPVLHAVRILITNPFLYRQELYAKLRVNQQTAEAFLARFRRGLSKEDGSAVQAFLSLQKLGFWSRRRALLRNRIFYSSWVRTLGLLLLA